MKELAGITVILVWLLGVVFAKGTTQVLCAVFFPPYAWYLVVERVAQVAGWT